MVLSLTGCYFSSSSILGRFGNGQGQEFAEHFLLEYWRDSLGKWVRYKDTKGEEVNDKITI